jgi:zinc D-Ala-D-Ala carboxypeptidase
MKMTKNFSLEELIRSNTAERKGIDNSPTAEHIHNLAALCENILQPLRDRVKHSIRITSGYRSERLNTAIGGASRDGKPSSEHCYGKAADIKLVIDGENRSEILYLAILEMGIPFRQMIWEFGTEDTPSWVHISFNKEDNKRQTLRAYKEGTRTKYANI